jgi:putative DNA primase/helicase
MKKPKPAWDVEKYGEFDVGEYSAGLVRENWREREKAERVKRNQQIDGHDLARDDFLYPDAEEPKRQPKRAERRAEGKRAAAEPVAAGDDAEQASRIAELARMSRLKYARERKTEAKEIGIATAVLDKLVAEQRKANGAGEALPAHWNVEPWPAPVDGAALLGAVADAFSRYAVLPAHAPETLALWVAHAWALDCFQCSPFATLVSPVKRCGKTRVLAILKWLAPRSELAGSISAAALFRYIEQERPTLLIDEFDLGGGDEEMRRILNSSHKRVGAKVIRCEGEDNRPRPFSTWAPKAIATITKLADTLRDRSILIEMRHKTVDEEIERWSEDDSVELATLRRKLLRWTEDNAEALKNAHPEAPSALDDGAADNWRPLLAIADAAGGGWPARARAAAMRLSVSERTTTSQYSCSWPSLRAHLGANGARVGDRSQRTPLPDC